MRLNSGDGLGETVTTSEKHISSSKGFYDDVKGDFGFKSTITTE